MLRNNPNLVFETFRISHVFPQYVNSKHYYYALLSESGDYQRLTGCNKDTVTKLEHRVSKRLQQLILKQ